MITLFSILFQGINLYFTLIMISLFLYGFIILCRPRRNVKHVHQNMLKNIPTFLTSLGIFGTFVGIVWAVSHFDAEHIRENINQIINGMQTAFITSVLGVFLSIILKILIIWVEGSDQDADAREGQVSAINGDKVLQAFMKQAQNSDDILSAVKELILVERNQVSGLKRLIKEHQEYFERQQRWQQEYANEQKQQSMAFKVELWTKLDDFAEILSKSATEQIIDALRQVIIDFNNKLTEQFGENFKQLNQAVGDLVTWQDSYKIQLEQMIAQYELGVQTIIQTAQAVEQIEQSTNTIPDNMEKLDDVIRVNQHQIDELANHLAVFAEIKDKAIAALPEIQYHIVQVLNNMEQGSLHLQKTMSNIADSFDNEMRHTLSILKESSQDMVAVGDKMREHSSVMSQELAKTAQEFSNRLGHSMQMFEQHINEIQAACNRSVTESANHLASTQKSVLNGLTKETERALEVTGESLQEQLKTMNRAVENHVNQIMQALGGHLLTMVTTFTQDYRQLVDRMNDIVRYGQNNHR